MTVCIAAACMDGDEHAIVVCSDGKGSTPLGSKEQMMKIRLLPHRWEVCTSHRGPNQLSGIPIGRLAPSHLGEVRHG